MTPALCVSDHCRRDRETGELTPRRAAYGLALCRPCVDRLSTDLVGLPGLNEDALDTGAHGLGVGKVSGSPHPPEPLSRERREARTAIRAELVSWCLAVMEDRQVSAPADTVDGMCSFLQRHLEWIAGSEHAEEFAHGIAGIAAEARRVAYPRRPTSTYIGDCPIEIEAEDGALGPCGAAVRAYAGESLVTCPSCGTFGSVEWWQSVIVGTDRIVTGAVLAALLSARYMRPIDGSTVRQWVHREKIGRVGADPKGRPLYDVDAVIAYTDTVWTPAKRSA